MQHWFSEFAKIYALLKKNYRELLVGGFKACFRVQKYQNALSSKENPMPPHPPKLDNFDGGKSITRAIGRGVGPENLKNGFAPNQNHFVQRRINNRHINSYCVSVYRSENGGNGLLCPPQVGPT
jgi:hypothetical protein